MCRVLVSLLASAALCPALFPVVVWAQHRKACTDAAERAVRTATARGRIAVIGSALALAAVSALHHPVSTWPAWWLYSQAGTALAVIDLREHRLPNRLIYPLAAAEVVALTAAAAASDGWVRLIRACLAAVVVGTCWLLAALAAPGGLGLGDVKLAAIAAAPLAWSAWIVVLDAQLVIFLLGLLTAAALAIARPSTRTRRMAIPLGPALVLGALITTLL